MPTELIIPGKPIVPGAVWVPRTVPILDLPHWGAAIPGYALHRSGSCRTGFKPEVSKSSNPHLSRVVLVGAGFKPAQARAVSALRYLILQYALPGTITLPQGDLLSSS